jgi:translation initiation factor IF-2
MNASSVICRQPVVAIVGHIDHGKTTLLDYIRKTAVAAKETGGITQRISAYEIEHTTKEGEKRALTFIDTPGHEAFQNMRRRGASAADIVILVIAADDGVKPQTVEAYRAIADAKVPFIVAFTKADKETANLDRARETVLREGIYLEGLGGDVPHVALSGKSGAGVSELLDLIILATDLHGISCDAGKPVQATVIESSRDPRSGISATVIVREGTLSAKGFAIAGAALAPLRVIEDFTGKKVSDVACGKPARVTGFTEEPLIGSTLTTVENKKEAESLAAKNAKPRATVKAALPESDERPTLRVFLKADTAGSLEALEYEVAKIPHERIEISVVGRGIGAISEADVKHLVGFSPAIAAGFNVKVESVAKDLAERQGVIVETRDIIYELADSLAAKAKGFTPPEPEKTPEGTMQILKHFSSSGSKHVVGGRMTLGALSVGDRVTITRRGVEIGPGKILNLQRDKANVSEVVEGTEFGAQVESKADIITGDIITELRMAVPKR